MLVGSTAAIMIKMAIDLGVQPLAVATGRISLAALILTPVAWSRSSAEIRAITRSDWVWGIGAGVFLASHFMTWISSLAYTSVASSTALVTTNPIFVALVSLFILRERLPSQAWLGILLTITGSVFVALSDHTANAGSSPLLGDTLALLGAISVSGYFLLGRRLRARLSLLPYIWVVYTTAAAILIITSFLLGHTLLGWPPQIYLLFLGLALGPQLLAHSAFNWALRYLSATVVTVAILGEPIGSALMAMVVLRQPLQGLQMLGGFVLLAGIAVTTFAERVTPPVETVAVEA